MTNSNKCNINFQSKFAYINNELIHIDNINDNNKSNLKCKFGHELIPVRGKKKIHHFRHKHKEDTCGRYLIYIKKMNNLLENKIK